MITLLLADRKGGLFDYSNKLRNALDLPDQSIQFADRHAAYSGGPLFLQYSGYGFARRGVPFWLLAQLRRDRTSIGTLGIFFHELFAFGAPWTSAFWLSPAQRHIAAGLVEVCDFWVTNRKESANWLTENGGAGKPNSILPVFSNVGEPVTIANPRKQQLVVFGSPPVRTATYLSRPKELLRWTLSANLQVLDIGEPITDPRIQEFFQVLRPAQLGRLPADEVSNHLSSARFGLLSYWSAYLAKSGIFAAYAAHGTTCVLIGDKKPNDDGLFPGIHYISEIPESEIFDAGCEPIRAAAHSWYQSHRISVHAATVLDLVNSSERK